MSCLIIAESAIFLIFVVAYLFYVGKSLSGPTPRQVLELPILNSICLLSSSATITLALRALRKGDTKRFSRWWLVTIVLGAYFLFGTGYEWHRLIYEKGFTLQTNLFGTTFYSLVGLHASHVVIGLLGLSLVHGLRARRLGQTAPRRTGPRAGALLAFCGLRVGRRVHRRLHHRALTKKGFLMNSNAQEPANKVIQVPACTGWPLVAAFGLTLVFAGLLTHVMISGLGAITLVHRTCRVVSARSSRRKCTTPWPVEKEEPVAAPLGPKVRHLQIGELGHRARLPLKIYPYSAGVRGGLVGGAAMARAGAPLRAARSQEYLVSCQPAGRRRLSPNLGHELRPTAALRWCGTGAGDRHSHCRLGFGGFAIRHCVADVPAASRFCSAGFWRHCSGPAFCTPGWAS